ncbi:MAG: DUF962 domain-containing protein [Enhydrobacter sp.]|nr:MAG: DUF962 domain-containing protein [Enhydrobacter sp.]
MANDLFRRELAAYAAVHRDWRNKATHFVGIPVIVFSLLLALTQWSVDPGIGTLPMALVVTIVAVLGWMALDLGIGLVMAAIMAVAWYVAEAFAMALGPQPVWTAFGVLFIGGWILQFLGHHYEGKRPALLSNIFQAFVGPMFLVAETMVAMGYRSDLAGAMDDHRIRA